MALDLGRGTPELGKGKAEHPGFHHGNQPRKGPTTFGCQCVTTLLQGHVSLQQNSESCYSNDISLKRAFPYEICGALNPLEF